MRLSPHRRNQAQFAYTQPGRAGDGAKPRVTVRGRLSRLGGAHAAGLSVPARRQRMRPPPPHRKNQLASTVCTPLTWMTLSAAKSASVFNWMKVSVPLVNQLIWPGAVNAPVPLKVKFWSPATVSSASMLVKWRKSPSARLKSVTRSGLVTLLSATDDHRNTSPPPLPRNVSSPRPPARTLTPSLPVSQLSNSLPIRLIAAVVVWSAYSTSASDPALRA